VGEFQVYKLDSATYSTIDDALNACDSARSGSKPLGNYLEDNTCQEKVAVIPSPPSCGGAQFWNCDTYDVGGYLFIGNYGSPSSCGYGGDSFLLKPAGWVSSATGELLCVSSTF
jgi:hypothetical protein